MIILKEVGKEMAIDGYEDVAGKAAGGEDINNDIIPDPDQIFDNMTRDLPEELRIDITTRYTAMVNAILYHKKKIGIIVDENGERRTKYLEYNPEKMQTSDKRIEMEESLQKLIDDSIKNFKYYLIDNTNATEENVDYLVSIVKDTSTKNRNLYDSTIEASKGISGDDIIYMAGTIDEKTKALEMGKTEEGR